MRAVLLTGHGGLDKLVYREDVADPVPGPADVLVRVGAAGLNNTDVWTREGAYGAQDDAAQVNGWRREPLSFPLIQGADIVGTVVAAGDDVHADRVGERVIVDNALYTGNGEGLLDPVLEKLPVRKTRQRIAEGRSLGRTHAVCQEPGRECRHCGHRDGDGHRREDPSLTTELEAREGSRPDDEGRDDRPVQAGANGLSNERLWHF